MRAKRFLNTLTDHQRTQLALRALFGQQVMRSLLRQITTAVSEMTPEQRADVRAAFAEQHPNFYTARS